MNTYGVQWDTTGQLPFPAPLQARYANGKYRSKLEYVRGLVYIDVLGNLPNGASWLDVENGDATPQDVPRWLDERAPFGEGGIYCNRANIGQVEEAAGDREHLLWVSTLDGTMDFTLPSGHGHLVAIQLYPQAMLGFHADLSVVVDQGYWDAHHA